MKITCATCIYMVESRGAHHCRRYPPQITDYGLPAWPLTSPVLWCGEHVPQTTAEKRGMGDSISAKLAEQLEARADAT